MSFALPSTNSKTQTCHLLTRPINPFSLPPSSKTHLRLPRPHNHRLPTITAAISRTKKEATVETVKQQLENCYLLAGINYKGFTVKQFQELRKSLPETTKLLVAKNTLLETLPTRAEIYANLLGSLKSPASALVSTLQAPARDVVMVLKAYVKKLEEEAGAAQS
ncbi:hypothetical protein Ahy_A01g001343 isoform B [Arachis hypogaea]|uniref:50S ribosomal protein L10 n=1 Tax=Arachis hypogaea TaxID=3818 RepID=A0A445EN63_ARAHY|nr:hypothetical protein Ahy_A01g001343 isoform B [Arachis hypogaea]